MLAWRSAETGLPWRHFGLLLLGLLISRSGIASETFNVRMASTQLVDGIYRLHAQIDYPLHEEVRKAVKSGIPLIVNQEIEIRRLRRWLWPKTIKKITLRYQLRYHALSEQFVLIYLSQGRQRAYPNLTAAIKRLSTIKDYPLITQEELEPHQRYRVRLRTRLSIEDLPVPMRPIAYLSPQWHLDSPWFSWLLGSPGL
ncbi:DUF4390 domain-containing protein [Nitrosococcus wardiae]|uniref:DUF4390 domain-containing protein n=1 Tax=Nitrosococcus wardiae TaxID=1814290 RepID=A0A4P7BUQ0_9GAMM|nr:DUF4390 domain-containing protein [Nitrosococcus wardiae]QBQ53678.1 DUF4390 domain-containing protein [Nitrosococcus wardiae]